MSPPKWPTRLLALLQLLLVLPPLASGSVCISADGTERLEARFCACMLLPSSACEVVMNATGTAECGQCRDELFTALRGARPHAPAGLFVASPLATSCVVEAAGPVLGPHMFRVGEPPDRRLHILRC